MEIKGENNGCQKKSSFEDAKSPMGTSPTGTVGEDVRTAMKIDKRTPADKEEAEGGAQATDKGG